MFFASPTAFFAQLSGCDLSVPPVSIGNLYVSHVLGENSAIYFENETGSNVFCQSENLSDITVIYLGEYIPLIDPPFNPFDYELLFSKPILSINVLLFVGDIHYVNGVLVPEDFHFLSDCGSAEISSVFSCSATVAGSSIFLGSVESQGSGIFNISFSEPVFNIKITGSGGGAGSGFLICSNSITPAPFYAALNTPQQACSQDSVSFTAYIGGQEPHPAPYTFSYTVNGGAVQTASTTGANESVQVGLPQTPGSYTYELLSVTDANGNSVNITCNNSQTVEVVQTHEAQFTPSPSTGFAPATITLNNQSTNATQYEWLLNNAPITPQNNTITLQDTGAYQITLIATNALGCTDTAVQTVHVLEQLQVTIPNVFTPNNDDVNDWFGFTANVEAEASLVILNRWGGVVFEKSFVTIAGSFMELWDGTSIGSVATSTGSVATPSSVSTPGSVPATDGVYFYKLVLSGEAWEETFVGSVTLRR